MKIYKYIVNKITTRGKEIEVYQDVVKSDLGQGKVYDILCDKYFGLSVNVEEVKELNELKSSINGRREIYSFENMYETYFNFTFYMDVDNEKIEKMRVLQKEIDDIKEELINEMREEVSNNPKYYFIRDATYNINIKNTKPATITGKVKADDVQLQEIIE